MYLFSEIHKSQSFSLENIFPASIPHQVELQKNSNKQISKTNMAASKSG
jgi:hypothetical protein